MQDEEEYHPSEIIKLCSNLENGYGCWIDDIRKAVETVDLSFTDSHEKWSERLASGVQAQGRAQAVLTECGYTWPGRVQVREPVVAS
jgi:hypothetical protein